MLVLIVISRSAEGYISPIPSGSGKSKESPSSELSKTMEGEIYNFIKIWISIFVSLSYCYAVGKITQNPALRLFSVLPIICLFLLLPLHLHSIHLGGITSFFIAWLANFKLLLFVFGKGPLCSDPSISLSRFVAVACFPIKIQQTRPFHSKRPPHLINNGVHSKGDQNSAPRKHQKSIKTYAVKGLLLAMIIRVYDYSDYLHPGVILFLYSLHIYFLLEIVLAIVAYVSRALLGLELEPQFNEPLLSTSLQEFWGKRWNIMVTSILRPTVYEPVLNASARVIGRERAAIPAILSTFAVSAVMHELIFYYLGRVKPTWEITSFFLLHGLCLVVEITLKKAVKGRWRLPRVLAIPMTAGFVLVTGSWLFFPPLLRCRGDVRAFEEYAAVGAFLKDVGRRGFSMSRSFNPLSGR